jgi:hypothetical protein
LRAQWRVASSTTALPHPPATAYHATPPPSAHLETGVRSGVTNVSAPPQYSVCLGIGARSGAMDMRDLLGIGNTVHQAPPPCSTRSDVGDSSGVTNASASPPYFACLDVCARSGATDASNLLSIVHAARSSPPYSARLEAGARSGVTSTGAPPSYSACSDIGARSGATDTSDLLNGGSASNHTRSSYDARLAAGAPVPG